MQNDLSEPVNRAEVDRLTAAVETNNEHAKANRRLTKWHAAVSLLLLIVVVQGAVNDSHDRAARKQARSVISVIEDCTTPGGNCSQENQKRLAGAILGVEILNNQTELEWAQRRGDPAEIDFRQKKIAELQAESDRITQGSNN